MKTRKFALMIVFLFAVLSQAVAQVPQSLNYQAVVRDGAGSILATTSVDVRFTVLDGATTVYEETHTATTTDHGLLNLIIGDGTPVTGTFSGIDWSTAGLSVKVEVDTGSGYVDMGTTDLESVPYALYAEEAAVAEAAQTAVYADTATVATTSLDAIWDQNVDGSIVYTDTAAATSGFIAGISSTTNINSNNNILWLYAPPGGPTDFNFIRMDHGVLPGSDKFIVKGDGTTYLSKVVTSEALGESGTAVAGALYEDNVPMAWAYISSSGVIQSSFGVQSATRISQGIYYVYLDNSYQGYPAVSVTGRDDSATYCIYGNVDPMPNSNEIRVYTGRVSSGSSAWDDASFHIVVYGRPQ